MPFWLTPTAWCWELLRATHYARGPIAYYAQQRGNQHIVWQAGVCTGLWMEPISRQLLYASSCAGPNSTVLAQHDSLMGHSLHT